MIFSICIPEYNRIEYLIIALDNFQDHCHSDFDLVISSDFFQEIIN